MVVVWLLSSHGGEGLRSDEAAEEADEDKVFEKREEDVMISA